jgi:uncharacterized membrane protein YfcA
VDIVFAVLAGASVGLAVGVTGVGGGSLMTPILLLFGVPLPTAVGTDLMYAAITKSGGTAIHLREKSISWPILIALACGSLPAALVTIICLDQLFDSPEEYEGIISVALGFMLIVTALLLVIKKQVVKADTAEIAMNLVSGDDSRLCLTFALGIVLGVTVTLSSVGAAAIATALILILFPRLPAFHVLGTNMAHAVPLTFVAGLGHLYLGNVDFGLLACLLMGSLPAIILGTRIARRLPDNLLQPLLAVVLLGVGIKYTFL